MKLSSTIAAISTAQAPGGIGVIRISGEEAISVADRVFASVSGKKLTDAKGYTAHFGHVVWEGEAIDEAIATVFRAPKSYTGENVVELSCHGGLYLTQSVLRAVFSAGAIPAQPGEFTRRAFLNGKMSLTSAEAVMDLISAQGEQAARAALADKNGALERRIAGVKEKLISSAAHLAAWADFPEEDIPEVTDDSLLAGLQGAKEEIGRLLRQFDIGSVIRDGVDTVILGRPNVGKSTLMNLLAGNEKSIVTSVAGTTRDIVEETVRAGEILLRLADTAGLRQTDDPVESIGVQRARERMASAQLILAVFDASEPLQEEDLRLLDTMDGRRAVAVINKSDLEQSEIFNKEYITNNLQHVVEVSAKQGKGVEALIAEIASVLGTADWNPAEGMLSTERQRVAAEQALQCVEEALDAVALGMTLDAITVSIEGAIEALAELTGENVSEAVVDGVFHRFCVGK